MKCRITRDKKGIDKHAFPTYYFHYEREDGKKVNTIWIMTFKMSRLKLSLMYFVLQLFTL